jgi:CRP-like cAMP-binding protein
MGPGSKPAIRVLAPDETLVTQGDPGDEIYLLLDGVMAVEVDAAVVAEIGPGAIIGERAFLEGGTRTATLRATTRSRVASASGQQLTQESLAEVAAGHRREDESA